jgi:hypothetical protein
MREGEEGRDAAALFKHVSGVPPPTSECAMALATLLLPPLSSFLASPHHIVGLYVASVVDIGVGTLRTVGNSPPLIPSNAVSVMFFSGRFLDAMRTSRLIDQLRRR